MRECVTEACLASELVRNGGNRQYARPPLSWHEQMTVAEARSALPCPTGEHARMAFTPRINISNALTRIETATGPCSGASFSPAGPS